MTQRIKVATLGIVSSIMLIACGGGGGGQSKPAGSTPEPTSQIPTTPVQTSTETSTESGERNPDGTLSLSGTISYDYVPHDGLTYGLDYAATTAKPARGVVTELISEIGELIDTSLTDAEGRYSFTLTDPANVRVQVKAQLLQSAEQSWDFSITDNTEGYALYALSGSLSATGEFNSERDLHASSGWDGNSYSGTRAAAPFAVLDTLYGGLQQLTAVDRYLTLPPLELHWSENNSPTTGYVFNGDIGTSYYDGQAIFLLGKEGVDTDEYDQHVVLHEWGHYLEDVIARSDSIGGRHSQFDRLDPRVAFAEGFGNALAGMILNDPGYRDSLGSAQSRGFELDMENNHHAMPGWFNEGSVQTVLYDLFDDANEAGDTLSLGLEPLYNALTASPHKEAVGFTTIFSFMAALSDLRPAQSSQMTDMLAAQSISTTDPLAKGETNYGGIAGSLPLYKATAPNGAPLELCSVNDAGSYNKLGVRNWAQFDLTRSGHYQISLSRISGTQNRNPDFALYKSGVRVASADSTALDSEIWEGPLNTGNYVLDGFDANNVSGTSSGDACYALTITPL